jgi:hypothetical protein
LGQILIQHSPTANKKSSSTEVTKNNLVIQDYLRCIKSPTNRLGESSFPQEFAAIKVVKTKDGHVSFPIKAWGSIEGHLVARGGPGFFAAVQHYQRSAKDELLKLMQADGWTFQRQAIGTQNIISAMIPVHVSIKNADSYSIHRRTLTLIEAKIGLLKGEIDLDGITVSCSYAKEKN